MAYVCDSCRHSFRDAPYRTVTGRELCTGRRDNLLGAAAAVVASGGVSEAIATGGWLQRIRRARRPE